MFSLVIAGGARGIDDRETAGCIDFDAALEAYLTFGDGEDLLRAASVVVGSNIPLDPERAETIADLTGTSGDELVDYDDAGRPPCGSRARGTEREKPQLGARASL